MNAPQIQPRYRDLVSLDRHGRLLASLSGKKLDPAREDLLLVQADEMELKALQHPNKAFDAICQDPETQAWIREMAVRKQPLYFIVGVQELKNATFKRAVIKEGPLGTSVTEAPVDAKIRIPIHVRRDSSMDITDSTTTGIYGVEVRKVQCRVGRSDEPHLLEDIEYSWNYHRIHEELQLSIGLGKALTIEELRLFSDTMSDEEEGSEGNYDSDSSES